MQLINNSVVSLTSNKFSYAIYNKQTSKTVIVNKNAKLAHRVFNISVLYVAKYISFDNYQCEINALIK